MSIKQKVTDDMIALKILDTNKFMSGFLKGTMLDHYQIVEGSITTFCTFTIDGNYQSEFFKEAEEESQEDSSRQFAAWETVKDYCFSLIKGKRTPLMFKFIFYYPAEKVEALLKHYDITVPENESYGLCMNLRFDSNGLVLTSGVSKKTFSLDRSVDQAWDSYLNSFLKHYEIASESLS